MFLQVLVSSCHVRLNLFEADKLTEGISNTLPRLCVPPANGKSPLLALGGCTGETFYHSNRMNPAECTGRNWLRYRYAKFKCHDVLCTFSRQQIVDLSANDISDQFVSSPRPAPKMMGRWCDTIAQPHGKHIPTNGDARVSLQGCLSISPWSALCRCFSPAAVHLCFVPGVFATQSSWLSRDLVFPNSHRFCSCHHLHLAIRIQECKDSMLHCRLCNFSDHDMSV